MVVVEPGSSGEEDELQSVTNLISRNFSSVQRHFVAAIFAELPVSTSSVKTPAALRVFHSHRFRVTMNFFIIAGQAEDAEEEATGNF